MIYEIINCRTDQELGYVARLPGLIQRHDLMNREVLEFYMNRVDEVPEDTVVYGAYGFDKSVDIPDATFESIELAVLTFPSKFYIEITGSYLDEERADFDDISLLEIEAAETIWEAVPYKLKWYSDIQAEADEAFREDEDYTKEVKATMEAWGKGILIINDKEVE